MEDKNENLTYFKAARPLKFITSFVLFFGSYSMGLMGAMIGPSMLSFSNKFDTTVGEVSRIVTVTQACYLAGALSASVLFKWINRHVGAIMLLTVIASGITALPHAPSITIFYVIGGIYGFGFGLYDPAQIAWVIDVWRHEAGPFILTQHFFYSCGTLTAPLLVEPFLPANSGEPNRTTSALTSEETSNSTEAIIEHEFNLYTPFAAVGGVVLTVAVLLAALFFVYRCRRSSNTALQAEKTEKELSAAIPDELPLKKEVVVIALCCLIVGFYQSMDINTMNFMTTFAHYTDVGLSESAAARVLSAMTFGYAAGRLAGIFLVLKVAPQFILFGNFTLMLIGNTILLTLGGSSVPWLWAGSICLGLGFSTVFPAFYAYIEKYIFVSNRVAAIISASAGLMTSIYPFVIGNSVETSPKILNYIDYGNISVVLVSFVALFCITHRSKSAPAEKSCIPA